MSYNLFTVPLCWLHISLYQEITYHGLISIFVEHVGNEIDRTIGRSFSLTPSA